MHATMLVVTSSAGESSGSRAKASKSRPGRFISSSSEINASVKDKKIVVRIREVVGDVEVERVQVWGHVTPGDGVGSKTTGHVAGDLGGR